MEDRPFKNKDKLQVCFTRNQAQLLEKEKEVTGNTKASIVRRAVENYFWKDDTFGRQITAKDMTEALKER